MMRRVFALACTMAALTLSPAFAEDQMTVASGNEPFWRADVSDTDLTLKRPGVDDLTLPVTQHAEMDDFAVVTAADPDLAVRAILLLGPGVCHDTMSGMPYPQTAQLALGDQVYTGCAGAPQDLLTRSEWAVEQINGAPVVEGSDVTLAFDDAGRVAGSGGCNRMSTGYTLTGEGLTIDPNIATTMMACPDPLMVQERAFGDALGQVQRFDIDDTGALILSGADGSVVRAHPMPM